MIDLVLLIGQSNAKGCGNPEESIIPQNGTFEYVENFTGNALIPLNVTLQLSEGRGTIAPSFANTLKEKSKNEICIIHYAIDGSRIKNWNHDKWLYLDEAILKFKNAEKYISSKKEIGKKFAVWIQGESDAKYGTDPLYYKKRLIDIGNVLKEKCSIDMLFVSATGYWQGDDDYLKRSERIAAVQESACNESPNITLISKTALTFKNLNLLQDEVHYSMKALNILGKEIAENITLYYNNGKKLYLEDKINLEEAKQYIKNLELLESR